MKSKEVCPEQDARERLASASVGALVGLGVEGVTRLLVMGYGANKAFPCRRARDEEVFYKAVRAGFEAGLSASNTRAAQSQGTRVCGEKDER